MRIKKLVIENFKSLNYLEIELKTFDCLVGSNNSGKTTLLQAIALFGFCVQNCLSRKNGNPIEIKARTFSEDEFNIIPVTSFSSLWTENRTQTTGNKKIFIAITATFDNDTSVTTSLQLNFNRLSITLETSNSSQEWLTELSQLRIAYLPVFSSFQLQEERRTAGVISNELGQGRVNTVIRNLLLELKNRHQEDELAQILNRSFPDLKKLKIEFDELNDRYISVTYQEENRRREFDLFYAGSGFQQFVYFFGFILLQQPSIILLDEPDVHLHATLQHSLYDELKRLEKSSNKQILYATHSTELIQQTPPENILSLNNGQAERLQVKYDVYDTLRNLGVLDVSQLALAQLSRKIILVENESDWEIISAFCKKTLPEKQWQRINRQIAICYTQGNPIKQTIDKFRQQLQRMLPDDGRNLQMFVIADRDYHPNREELLTKLEKDTHLTWHIWERVEIENYLLNAQAIHRVIARNPLGKDVQLSDIQAQLTQFVQEQRDTVQDRLVKAFHDYDRSWDASTCSKKAREYLNQHWETQSYGLADAKEVLAKLKQWSQEKRYQQFSDKNLTALLLAEELPQEIHDFANRLYQFLEKAH
jgi:predicted ATP-dependent endonuclease of OLD family